ncbi:general secretion pathway protein GspB [Pseudomonas silvicola]|nr:general secretion pathway protein GspB [Pseudomonas silvicola]
MRAWRRPLVQLLAGLALMLAGLLAWLATGVGSQPQWPVAEPVPVHGAIAPAVEIPAGVALGEVANAWQAPLFSPAREPDRSVQMAKATPDLSGLRLTGVVIDGTVRRALFKQADGHDLSLREGGQLASGWRLQRIEAQAVVLELNGQVRRLQLPSPRLPNMPVPAPASSILLNRSAPSSPAPGGH